MLDHHDAEPTPVPHDPAPHPGVAEIAAALARVGGARLAGRPLAARTSFQEHFDRALLLLGAIGDARRYLGEAALAATGLTRPDYVPLTRDQLNDSIAESVAAEEEIVALLQGFVEPAALASVTERGGGGFGVAAAVARIHALAQCAAADPSAVTQDGVSVIAQGCLEFKRLGMSTGRGPTSLPLPEHYDLATLARIAADLVAIWKRWRGVGWPVPDAWDAGLLDAQGITAGEPTLRPTPVEVACRLIAKTINALEAREGTALTWEWGAVRRHLNAYRAAR